MVVFLLPRRERRAVRAVDVGHRDVLDVLGLVLVERLRVRRDRRLVIAARLVLRAERRVVVADRRARRAAACVIEAAQLVLALNARRATLVLARLLLGPRA